MAAGGAIVLRPGVSFPDWSAVRSPVAVDVVRAVIDAFDVETRWRGYDEDEDRLHVALLELYGRHGRAPTMAELAAGTGLAPDTVARLLTRLGERDMVVLDADSGAVVGAYPFTENDTGHRVELAGSTLNAMCAIDALGAGAMYGVDSVIESSCRQCGAGIRIATGEGGASVRDASPPEAVVLAGIQYRDRASTSLCTVISFFCSDRHLQDWRAGSDGSSMFRMTLDDALQAGRAIFTPFLAEPRDIGIASDIAEGES